MNGYVAAGYGVTTAAVLCYVWRMMRRARVLSRSLPADERTWK